MLSTTSTTSYTGASVGQIGSGSENGLPGQVSN
jgi:hypothetical protein